MTTHPMTCPRCGANFVSGAEKAHCPKCGLSVTATRRKGRLLK